MAVRCSYSQKGVIRMTNGERKERAKGRAVMLPPGDYHAYDSYVVRFEGGRTVNVIECESHWDACLVLLAIEK